MIIGITGRARAGKDSVAKILRNLYGARQYSFAAPIRQFVADLCGMTLAELGLRKGFAAAALGGKTPRFAMQTLGTEWGRETIYDSIWVDKTLSDASRCPTGLAVIPDVRFANEASAILAAGGMVIRVTRPGEEIAESEHSSESGVPDVLIHSTIANDGDLEDLERKVRAWFSPRDLT